ncbi:MAG: diguanylate cyclase [Acidobacteria bacterium]|nr:diguanylate cyclase [Acidobacteriota bacterium]MCB9398337.1 diguanylate cyclase [Acidobacteriota bacterium]
MIANFLLLLALTDPAEPQGRFRFKTYGLEQGLTNQAVRCVLQDVVGFIWVGTEGGLFRWDGFKFDHFGVEEGLPSNEVHQIFQDVDGRLWVLTRLGLVQFIDGSIRACPEGLPDQGITQVSALDRVWVATQTGIYGLSFNRFLPIPGWPGAECSALFGDLRGDTLWAARRTERTEIYTLRHGQWNTLSLPEAMQTVRIDGLVVDENRRVWARSARSLWVCSDDTSFEAAETPFEIVSSFGYLKLGRKGDVWVPTDYGIGHFWRGQWQFLNMDNGLPYAWSRDVLEDREGSVWVATSGLVRLLGRGVWSSHTTSNGLPSDVIWCLKRDSRKRLWVGTDKGLAWADADRWHPVPATEKFVVRSMVERENQLFMAGFPTDHLLRYDPQTQVTTSISLPDGLNCKRIFRLALDVDQRIIIASDGAGLWQESAVGSQVFALVDLPDQTEKMSIRDVRVDPSGRILVTSQMGLYIRTENTLWHRLTKEDGLLNNSVFATVPIQNGAMLVAYNEPAGLSRVTGDNGMFDVQAFQVDARLAGQRVYLIGQDAMDRCWIGTGQGVSLIDGERAVHFGIGDGLVGEDCDNMAFWPEPNGDVWIGTSVGLAHFSQSAYWGPLDPPRTTLTQILLGKKNVRESDSGLEVRHTENTFQARFAGLSFVNEQQVEFEIRMVGLDSGWISTDSRVARYPGLDSGAYQFEARSRLGSGAWGNPVSFQFTIVPAWWQTWIFKLFVFLLCIVAIQALVRWRMKLLQRRNRQLEALVEERTVALRSANEALEQANRALLNQSLTDPLTGLKNRRYLDECIPNYVAQTTRTHRDVGRYEGSRINLNIDLLFILVDIDHFKKVNDQFGHVSGDMVLQQVSHILEMAIRDTDTLIRWGGEEFLIVARNTCRWDFSVLAERIRSQVEKHEFVIDQGRTTHCTCSLGFAFFPLFPKFPDQYDWEKILNLADQCLYAAKHNGRNAWVGLVNNPQRGPLPEGISDRALQAADLVEKGWFTVESSFGPQAKLEWVLKDP